MNSVRNTFVSVFGHGRRTESCRVSVLFYHSESTGIHRGKLQPHCVAAPRIKQLRIASFTHQLLHWGSFRPRGNYSPKQEIRNTASITKFCGKLLQSIYEECEPGSSVSIVSGYGLNDRAIEVRSPAEAKGFFL
jgi:hypothetical protein